MFFLLDPMLIQFRRDDPTLQEKLSERILNLRHQDVCGDQQVPG